MDLDSGDMRCCWWDMVGLDDGAPGAVSRRLDGGGKSWMDDGEVIANEISEEYDRYGEYLRNSRDRTIAITVIKELKEKLNVEDVI